MKRDRSAQAGAIALTMLACSSTHTSGDAGDPDDGTLTTSTTSTTSTATDGSTSTTAGVNQTSANDSTDTSGSATTSGGGSASTNGSTGTTSDATASSASSASSTGGAGGSSSVGSVGGTGGATASGTGGATSSLSFFVTSQTHPTANLGGLSGADTTCQDLAAAVGAGHRTWRAYLSVESDADNGGMPTHARDRIGTGPWVNANGVTVAESLEALHAMSGDVDVFVDESGNRINGQWQGSPSPNEHDILTGSSADGMLMEGMTCADWTSDSADGEAQVGHSDGLGPNMNDAMPYNSWNSAHANQGCDDTAPSGGAGRFYCFARD